MIIHEYARFSRSLERRRELDSVETRQFATGRAKQRVKSINTIPLSSHGKVKLYLTKGIRVYVLTRKARALKGCNQDSRTRLARPAI